MTYYEASVDDFFIRAKIEEHFIVGWIDDMSFPIFTGKQTSIKPFIEGETICSAVYRFLESEQISKDGKSTAFLCSHCVIASLVILIKRQWESWGTNVPNIKRKIEIAT